MAIACGEFTELSRSHVEISFNFTHHIHKVLWGFKGLFETSTLIYIASIIVYFKDFRHKDLNRDSIHFQFSYELII